ncbi:hypothetical protein GALMADRAFT_225612 [Galerina marginata CBS 339.88]|uniref:Uncharacterized protein n=1 Tax=Galerina marginata (strain CBS 339.88) TaxID=685588 RepID=A0A067T0E2_GALM3|nr:hypothetical protein GALMADRAFT_225612 [Galerina marginata CBS 339.88]
MNQEGRSDGPPTPVSGYKAGTLLLTLCHSFKIDELPAFYKHAVVPFPQTYKDAKLAARQAFSGYFSTQTSPIVLKCAIRRKDGSVVWASINPNEWSAVVRPDDGEIGVFVADHLHAPYLASFISPDEGDVQKAAQKMIRLEIKAGLHDNDVSMIIGAPPTLPDLEKLAEELFLQSNTTTQASPVRIQISISSNGDWIDIHNSGYARIIETGNEPIEMLATHW